MQNDKNNVGRTAGTDEVRVEAGLAPWVTKALQNPRKRKCRHERKKNSQTGRNVPVYKRVKGDGLVLVYTIT